MTTVNRKMVTAVGAFVLGSLATVGTANATGFQATELAGGYQLAAMEAACGADKAKSDDKAKEGKCGEGKCGADKAKAADKAETKDKATTEKAKEGKCGEGKCGEGKCGGMN
jgi:uncharacterized low-complexity protein